MRLVSLGLQGYGRFREVEVRLDRRITALSFPDEQGVATFVDFLCGLFHGHRAGASHRDFDRVHDLRRPLGGAAYAGRMAYTLENRHAIEVTRDFAAIEEGVHLTDTTLGRDITASFPVMRNGEVAFAGAHLGLTRALIRHVAVISPQEGAALGWQDTLAAWRERMLTLLDSAGEVGSHVQAIAALDARLALIGRGTDAHGAIRRLRARLTESENARTILSSLKTELAECEEKRQEIRKQLDAMLATRDHTLAEHEVLDREARLARLDRAERLQSEIDRLHERTAAMGTFGDFPLEREQELEEFLDAISQTRAELEDARRQLETHRRAAILERDRLGPLADSDAIEVAPEDEKRLRELRSALVRLEQQLSQLEAESGAAQGRFEQARDEADDLPDFTFIEGDPILWVNQLASALEAQRRARDEEALRLEPLAQRVRDIEERLAEPRAVFSAFTDFPAELSEYASSTRVFEENAGQLRSREQILRRQLDEREGSIPRARNGAVLGALAAVAFFGVAWYMGNPGVYVPGLLCAGMAGVFALTLLGAYGGARQTRREIDAVHAQRSEASRRLDHIRAKIDRALVNAGCATLRELEARYEGCLEANKRLEACLKDRADQEARLAAEQEQLDRLFAQLQKRFAAMGAHIVNENGIHEAREQAVACYRQWVQVRRKMETNRDLPNQLMSQLDQLRRRRDTQAIEVSGLEERVRRVLELNGLPRQEQDADVLVMLDAFRARYANLLAMRRRIASLDAETRAREEHIVRQQEALRDLEDELDVFLHMCGTPSVEDWREFADQALQYRDLCARANVLVKEQGAILGQETLEELRGALLAPPVQIPLTGRDAQEVQSALDALEAGIQTAQREERSLETAIMRKSAETTRLESAAAEHDKLRRRLRDLEEEREASSYAASVLERTARERLARIAPLLARNATRYASDISGGAIAGAQVGPDLHIVPQTTLDNPQVRAMLHFALRLALLESINPGPETAPAILHDPFTGFDAISLERALALLDRLSDTRQFLLLTARRDTMTAAHTARLTTVEM